MASGNRASMREGPLAALFRKTDEERPPEDVSKPEEQRSEPPPPATAAAAAPPVPAAKERLQNVFSPDIPENILERPGSPDRPRYGRAEPGAPTSQTPIMKPILRVVGVGGAGVNAVDRILIIIESLGCIKIANVLAGNCFFAPCQAKRVLLFCSCAENAIAVNGQIYRFRHAAARAPHNDCVTARQRSNNGIIAWYVYITIIHKKSVCKFRQLRPG